MFIQDKSLNFVEVKYNPWSNNGKFVMVSDFDGVITNQSDLRVKYLTNLLGKPINPNQCTRKYCLEELGLSKEVYEDTTIRACTLGPEELPLERDFLPNFNKLRQLDNLKIFLLTSRYGHMVPHLESYLKHHNLKFDGIVHTNCRPKSDALESLKANLFVDDDVCKINQVILDKAGLEDQCRMVLFTNPQNEGEQIAQKGITRVKNWFELKELVTFDYLTYLR